MEVKPHPYDNIISLLNFKKCKKLFVNYLEVNLNSWNTHVFIFINIYYICLIMSRRFSVSESLESYYDKVVVDLRGEMWKKIIGEY